MPNIVELFIWTLTEAQFKLKRKNKVIEYR